MIMTTIMTTATLYGALLLVKSYMLYSKCVLPCIATKIVSSFQVQQSSVNKRKAETKCRTICVSITYTL